MTGIFMGNDINVQRLVQTNRILSRRRQEAREQAMKLICTNLLKDFTRLNIFLNILTCWCSSGSTRHSSTRAKLSLNYEIYYCYKSCKSLCRYQGGTQVPAETENGLVRHRLKLHVVSVLIDHEIYSTNQRLIVQCKHLSTMDEAMSSTEKSNRATL